MKIKLITGFLTDSKLSRTLVPIGVATVVTCCLLDGRTLAAVANVVSLATQTALISFQTFAGCPWRLQTCYCQRSKK